MFIMWTDCYHANALVNLHTNFYTHAAYSMKNNWENYEHCL